MKRVRIGKDNLLLKIIDVKVDGILLENNYSERFKCYKNGKVLIGCPFVHSKVWEAHYYPKSHKTTLYSIWFLGKLVGKDVARLIGRMIWKSRYDFIWEAHSFV